MKKIIALLLAAVMLTLSFSLTACGAKGKSLADVKKAGKLVVATSPDFPPFESKEGGKVVGIEVEILEIICKKLGVDLEIVEMDFDTVLAGIQSAKYDCGMSGITVTADREKSMLFTDPYYNAAQVIVVKEGSDIKTKADLKDKTVSVQTGTTAESGCKEENIKVQAFNANADAKAALTTGKVKAWIVDDLTAAEMCKGDDSVKILSDSMTTEPYAFAFNFADEALVEQFNTVLSELIADGTVAALFEQFDAPYTAPVVE
jgi:polar amino acid transport system substrate-binding protein